MRSLAKRSWLRLAALALLLACFSDCRRRPAETSAEVIAAGEPEVYAATINRAAADGAAQEAVVSRVARRGDWRREQWTEVGGERALILRPDLGKGYLLDLGHRVFVEFDYAAGMPSPLTPKGAARETTSDSDSQTPAALQAGEVDRALSDAPAPVQVETRVLADQTVQGYACQVVESRATFADGRVEITRSRRARDLDGLPLLIEVESAGGARFTVERRDIRLDVSPDEFTLPADFRRVERLPVAPAP